MLNSSGSPPRRSLASSLHVDCRRLVHWNSEVYKRRATSDDVSSLLCHHDGWSIQVAANDAGHDGGVDHTEPLETQNARVWVDDRHRVRRCAHLASAGRMVGAVGLLADKSVDVSVGLDLRTRLDFGTTKQVEGLLGKNLSGEFNTLSELPDVNIWDERIKKTRITNWLFKFCWNNSMSVSTTPGSFWT